MSAPPSINPSDADVRLGYGTPLSPSTGSTSAPSVSMFSNAKNTLINNSSFSTAINYITMNGSSAAPSLDLLHKSAAPNAILNSGGRADEVRCHPGTREEVIGQVEKSISQQYSGPRMLWLSGPAGAGKSAIMQTVAERCKEQGVPQANFFFFRADKSRSDANPFVATIMHQIIQLYPAVGPTVAAALTSDPLLFRMSIQQQFDALLREALATVQRTLLPLPPLTLLVDGLDECDSENKTGQRQLLQALDTLLIQKGPHFRVVVASRVEPQISMAFGQLRSKVDSIFLDEKYSPERDIHRFVTAEFKKIKLTHYLASTLDPKWPSASDVAAIVSKSSGQFIFAATIMRFIAYSPASPILSLLKVHGIVPPTKNSPFAQLDAIYAYILEQVDDWEAVRTLLAMQLVDPESPGIMEIRMAAYQTRFSNAVFNSCLSELAPLVHSHTFGLEFFHASFPDFLRDETRSGVHHLDLEAFCTAAIPNWWLTQNNAIALSAAIQAFATVKQPTSEITAALMNLHEDLESWSDNRSQLVHELIGNLHRIYGPHDLQSFIGIMHIWTSKGPKLARHFPQNLLQSATPERNSQMPLSTPQMPPPLPTSETPLSTSETLPVNQRYHLRNSLLWYQLGILFISLLFFYLRAQNI